MTVERLMDAVAVGIVLGCAVFWMPAQASTAAQAPNSWSYNGPLGTNQWWNSAYPTCDGAGAYPEQSPINITTASVISASVSKAVLQLAGTSTAPPHFLHGIITSGAGSVNMFNTLRADVWPSEFELDVAAAVGIPRITNKTKFFLNSITLHGPAEHTIDGVAADLEVQYVFFRNSAKTPSTGALVISMLVFGTTATSPRSRVEEMLASFTRKSSTTGETVANTGAVLLPLTFPSTAGAAVLYNGSLSFPPCWGGATNVVFTTSVGVDRKLVAAIRSVLPRPLNGRAPQLLRGRRVDAVRVSFKNAELVFPITTYRTPASAVASSVQIADDELDMSGMAIQFTTLYTGLICMELLLAAAYLFVERRTFVSLFRDEWRNQLTDKGDFGSAPPPLEVPQADVGDEEDEEGDYEDDDDDEDE